MKPTTTQLYAISITERICSTISLAGTSIIVLTFICSRSFRKPINRLVFYASWGNIMANIATLISQDGIHAGIDSSLCQFQGFLIQWFMPADALWTFAMACNVYLTFFHKYDSEQLRAIEWKYLICCYGVPFIPALTYFFIKNEVLGRVYGSAILWCWVSSQWDWLRIATFYGPVWLVIILTFAIYIRAGSVIYAKRRQFRNLGNIDSFDSEMDPGLPLVKAGIQVTSEIAYSEPGPEAEYGRPPNSSGSGSGKGRYTSTTPYYSVTIQGGRSDSMRLSGASAASATSAAAATLPRPASSHFSSSQSGSGLVLAQTLPSRLERVDTTGYSRRRSGTGENSTAAWAYTKYAMLFFVALLVTWVPSTVNRVYALARPDDFSFGLNFASSFVLPLQGFWNSLIYVSISWPAFKIVWRDFKQRSPLWKMVG